MIRALALVFLVALGRLALAADATPFYRMSAPVVFHNTTTTPRQWAISQPLGATSYRFVNSCKVDVVISTVPDMNTAVTADSGTIYLARTDVVTASSAPITAGPIRYVSIMALDDPGSGVDCAPRLIYGAGQ